MALISCPECTKYISDKANNCPYCGYPLTGANGTERNSGNVFKNPPFTSPQSNMQNTVPGFNIQKPVLRDNLWLGRPCFLFARGIYRNNSRFPHDARLAHMTVWLHTHGVAIWYRTTFWFKTLHIHHSQIIDFKRDSHEGLSMTKGNMQVIEMHKLVINYWDVKYDVPAQLAIEMNGSMWLDIFIGKYHKRIEKTRRNNVKAHNHRIYRWAIYIMLLTPGIIEIFKDVADKISAYIDKH